MKNNQKGFSLVEGMLLVLVIAVVGFGGYYVWNQQQKKDTSSQPSPTSSESTNTSEEKDTEEEQEVDKAKDWTVYSGTSFSVKIPDGWELIGNREYKNIAAYCSDNSCVTYKEGTRGKVQDTEGGRGGPFKFGLFANSNAQVRGAKVEYNEKANYPVEKYKFTQTGEQEPMDIPTGGTEYLYIVDRGDDKMAVTYALFSADDKDESNIVDLLVASIK